MTLPVTDAISNRNEHLIEAVRAIGRAGGLKHQVFEAIYYHKKRAKTVGEIASATGLTRMQVLQSAGALKKAGIVKQDRVNGDTAYVQIESFQHLKPQIQSLLKSPQKIKEIATKRSPAPIGQVKLTKPSESKSKRSKSFNARKTAASQVRLALLVTNPERHAPLQTGIEARDIQKAIESTPNAAKFEVKIVLAPTFDDLIDNLNQFDPRILHFSGHGGGSALLLDNERAGKDGGEVLDFDMAAKLLRATAANIKLLVLAACDTVAGADCLLTPGRAIIAMSDSIEDEAACAFSARLYKSLASGASIRNSLEQAKLLLEQKGYLDAVLPTLIISSDQDGEIAFV